MDELKQMMSLVIEKVDLVTQGLDEVKQKLNDVNERLDAVEQRLDKVEQRLDAVEQRLDKVEQRLDVVEQRLDTLEKRVDKLEIETAKNSIMLEDMKRKVELLAEIQQSYMQQNAREHEELKKYIDERVGVVEMAVRTLADDVSKLKDQKISVEAVAEILGRHEIEIGKMRRILTAVS